MERDGNKISLWQDNTHSVIKSTTDLSAVYDVVIVGGGVTGVATSLLLQQAGKKCLLVDMHNLGFGTTGGTTAHLNTLLDTPYSTISKNFNEDTSRMVASAASRAIKLIEDHIEIYQIDCEFKRAAAYLFSENEEESKTLLEIYEASKNAGLDIELTATMPLNAAFEKCVRANDQAKFHPLKYIFGLAEQFQNLGGHIVEHCKVESSEEVDNLIMINSTKGLITCKKMIYATHIPPGINLVHLRCAPWRSYAIACTLQNDHYPEGLVYDMKDPYHYYRSQVIDGKTYLIAGGKDHKTGDATNTEQSFRELKAHVENIFDVKDITHQWSSQYFEPADGLPYIGVLPGAGDNYYVATGFGGNGMIYSHIAAQELTSIITSGHSAFNSIFSPTRLKPVAGFTNFIDHNADVVKHFIGKFINPEHLEELASLAPGEGKVVKINGHMVAVSKEHDGKLHAVSSICTHMKCNVAWNGAERSWDCPCHGARYSIDGQLLTGPASHDLEVISLATLMEA